MRNESVPKTIQKWIDANLDKIEEYWLEPDGYGDENNPYSLWLYLHKDYFCPHRECRTIHAATVADAMDQLKAVIPMREFIAREEKRTGRKMDLDTARYLGIDPDLL